MHIFCPSTVVWRLLSSFPFMLLLFAAANIDYHTFLRKDSLVFFAASNDGSEGGYGSIQPESQARSTVGFDLPTEALSCPKCV
jgi:hypothetical protein